MRFCLHFDTNAKNGFYTTQCCNLTQTETQTQTHTHSVEWRIQDFPEEGAPTPQGAPTYDFAKFCQKLHETERIWPPRGVRLPCAPLRSATGVNETLNLESVGDRIMCICLIG